MYPFKRLPFYALALASFAFASCESEDPVMENEEELITDVTLSFTELNATGDPIGIKISFKASDPQGIELGITPTIEPVNLTKGKTYRMEITVANAIANEDITSEILAEGDEHQFYFLGNAFSSSILSIAYDDPSGELIGLQNIVSVSISPGTNNTQMQVVLRHALEKNYPGATNPNFQNYEQAGGESDLDINFPVVIN